MKRVLKILFLLILTQSLDGQELTQVIRGTVVDQLSQQSLPGATVIILNTDPIIGTTTDLDGKFRLEDIPIGRQGIKVTYLGYKDYTLPNMIVNAHKEIVLNIELEEHAVQMEEVVISGRKASNEVTNDLVTISARGFNMEETNRYAGSWGDPSRMVANYAGVSGANDARNDIIVRGNSPLGVLFRLDDIDIPNPNHFSSQGATGGPVSILNNNLLDQSDFLTGAFPAEFGTKTAAVFDLKMRRGNDEKHEFTTQFGFNGLELMAEGPFSKNGGSSFLASYRYSTLFIFDWLNIDLGAPALPRYQDLSFKLHFPTKRFGNFSLLGMGGRSRIDIIDADRKQSESNLAPEAEEGFDLYAGSDMGVVGLTNKHLFNNKTYGKIVLSVSAEKFNLDIDSVLFDTTGISTGIINTYHDGTYDGKTTIYYVLNHKFNSRQFVKGGMKYYHLFYNLDEHAEDFVIANSKGSTGLIQSFLHWQWKITDVLATNFGINSQVLLLNDKQTFEPRLGIKWDISERSKFSLGWGIHNQMQPLSLYLLETKIDDKVFFTNKELDFTRSIHYIAGYNYMIRHNWIFKSEAYYQEISQLPVEGTKESSLSIFNSGTDYSGIPSIDSLISNGMAQTYGLELTLERTFSKGFYFMYNTSVFSSKYKGSDGTWRSSAFDGGYIINLLGGAEFDISKNKKRILIVDVKATFAGGKRYTPINVSASRMARTVVYIDDEAYSQQFDDYSRLDLKLGFRENYRKVTIEWYISIQNIFNKKNILTQVYNQKTLEPENVNQLGRLPIGGFKMAF
ncbi:TonB-dependent receptor [Candidatus Amoebophilus asiaticus]|nr:TonB-dependent receptor [Candidatus Amoebophilus asiaticus]